MGWMGGSVKTPGPTEQEKALSKDAVWRFNDHQQNFVPLENSFIASLTASDGETAMHHGTATTDVQQAVAASDANMVAASRGQAGQGKSVMARANLNEGLGKARGEGVTGADNALRTREMAGLQKMSSFGRGLQDMNSLSMADAAGNATSAAINKLNVAVQNKGSLQAGLGAFAGSALGNIGSMESAAGALDKKWGTSLSAGNGGML